MRYLSWDLGRALTLALGLAGSVGACAVADENDATTASELSNAVTVTLTATTSDASLAITLVDNSSFVCNPCSVSFPQGSSTNLHTTARVDRANCKQMTSWTGACAGQSIDECDLTMTGNLTVGTVWGHIPNCFIGGQ